MYDVAIIGAGITGAMIARELSKYDVKTVVLEKECDVSMGATKANSAIVHAGFDAENGSLKALLNVKGSEMFEQVCADLGVEYIKNGSLVVGFDGNDKSHLKRLLERGNKNKVKGLRLIGQEELRKLEPNISDDATCALYAPTGAITSPYELCIAAMGNAMDNGVELKTNFEVTDIKCYADGFEIFSGEEKIFANRIINAAGVYADSIAKMAGDDSFTIIPRRGEYILLDKECGKHLKQTIFKTPNEMGKGILASPTASGNIILGPTSENIEDKDDKNTTSKGLDDVKSGVFQSVKGINLGKSITSFTGLRAVGSTGDFIINSPVKGFINVAGIESPGLSSAPAIAEYVIDMLSKNLILQPKENWNGTRRSARWFKELSLEEKNKVIKENPAYGRIICRCETVTEGEILEAMAKNPKPCDLDGVKRRTRAQMGRCQGGFCSPYIMKLLAENKDLTTVNKSGKGYLVTGKTKEVK